MATFQNIEDSIRGQTNHDTDTQVTQDQIYLWINEELPVLARRLANVIPDRYTKLSPDFTIVAGNSQDLTAAPTSLTDFSRIRCVQVKSGTIYGDLDLAPNVSPETVGWLCWRQRGASTVDLFPLQLVSGQTYRVKYIYKPAPGSKAAPGLTIDLPDGCEQAINALVAMRCRHRDDDDFSLFERERERVWQVLVQSLLPFYMDQPQGIVDVTGRYR